jgi:tRNA/tmRNA/rRNA uracil-C5-methylase (TrmA/RlmC/RlmD family)
VLMVAEDGTEHITRVGESAPDLVTETVHGRRFAVSADGFWQAHPAAAETYVDAVLGYLPPVTGGSAWDLYGGVGVFAAFLADAVGPTGSVTSVEMDPTAAELARRNLADLPQVRHRPGMVEKVLRTLPGRVDVVVLDPPRTGAGRTVCVGIADRSPAAIVYVACDPAALARDTATLRAHGYRLDALRCFDSYPQTHHVECVARFVPASSATHPDSESDTAEPETEPTGG